VDGEVIWYQLGGAGGYWLGVKRGTVLISSAHLANGRPLTDWLSFPLDSHVLGLPPSGKLRIAGQPDVYHLTGSFAQLPLSDTSLRGIRVQDGVIRMPTDGNTPSFSPL
jgi:hypothetical protein